MTRSTLFLVTIVFCAVVPTFANYSVSNQGKWPQNWPKELEPLRKQAQTYIGPMIAQQHFLIPFTKREEFEAAWPHLLKVKSKGAPIILLRGPKTGFMEIKPGGVIIHSPSPGKNDKPATSEAPIPSANDLIEWRIYTTFIELVVDGEVVDLNRIPLPADTPIIDDRFKDGEKK